MVFGFQNGACYEGYFRNNLKHGFGAVLCGNGIVVRRNPLFLYDKPVHLTRDDFYAEPIDRDKMCIYIPSEFKTSKFTKKDKTKLIPKPHVCGNITTLEADSDDVCDCCPAPYDFKKEVKYYRSETAQIPIHCSSHLIDCSFYILFISDAKYVKEKSESVHQNSQERRERLNSGLFRTNRSNLTISDAFSFTKPKRLEDPVSKMIIPGPVLSEPNLELYETTCTQDYLLANLPRLWDLYRHYSNIGSKQRKVAQRVVMIRLFLWQFYRDCRLTRKVSLAKIDSLLAENPTSYVESLHDPFEKLYFWQFLHSLLGVAWELYSKNNVEGEPVRGLLAGALCKLLFKDIYPHAFHQKGKFRKNPSTYLIVSL